MEKYLIFAPLKKRSWVAAIEHFSVNLTLLKQSFVNDLKHYGHKIQFV